MELEIAYRLGLAAVEAGNFTELAIERYLRKRGVPVEQAVVVADWCVSLNYTAHLQKEALSKE